MTPEGTAPTVVIASVAGFMTSSAAFPGNPQVPELQMSSHSVPPFDSSIAASGAEPESVDPSART